MNKMLRRSATASGLALVAAVALASLLGSSSAGASVAANASARAVALGRTTACADKTAAKPWSFAIEADTQWTTPDDGKNPNTCSVDIARQLDSQFIGKGVKFVVEVGDLVDQTGAPDSAKVAQAEDTRAVFAQELYKAGIGFYPLVGNHDDGAVAAAEFTKIYPQTQNAVMNNTPASAFSVTNPDALTQPFPVKSGASFTVGKISASPAAPSGFAGLDYAVDYKNARLVFLDQFTATGTAHEALTADDVSWLNGQLSGRPKGAQAFVFGHKGLITQNHVDTLFGSDPAAQPALQNTFVSDLAKNHVHYYIGGHDHMYNRAVVASPDGASSVQDIVSASDASKFYIPFGSAGYAQRSVDPITKAVSTTGTLASADPTQTNDYIYNTLVAGGTTRETPLAQELNRVGYFIVTVDGANVTVDYYSAEVDPTLTSGEYLLSTTPKMTFVKRESFGYGLNGKEFFVSQGHSYKSVVDHFRGTTARILGGVNGSVATDAAGRKLTKDVDTGWSAANRGLDSNVLNLWGLADVGRDRTDTYALSMSFNGYMHRHGHGMLAARKANGKWVNAVDLNVGGAKRFVHGPWKAKYGLGTFGIDWRSHTVWAIVDHAGQFAVTR